MAEQVEGLGFHPSFLFKHCSAKLVHFPRTFLISKVGNYTHPVGFLKERDYVCK